MTASQAIEMRLTGRAGSDVPGQVVQGLTGVHPEDPAARDAMSTGMHWAHGVAGSGVRRALGIADSPWRWSKGDLATDLFHKGLYSAVMSTVFTRLGR